MTKSDFTKRGKIKNSASIFITLVVVLLIVLSGPAAALTIGISNLSNSSPTGGSTISFLVKIDIHTSDRVPIKNTTVNIKYTNNTIKDTCTFDLNGNNLTTCSNFTITKISGKSNYSGSTRGYGYGYDGSQYQNISFGYGYTGYYGYGYDSFSDDIKSGATATTAEFIYNITYTTPSLDSSTQFNINALTTTNDGTVNQIFEAKTATSINVIENTPPTITGQTISPSTAYTNSTLNCSATYSDSGGSKGNVSISWYNGSALYSATTILNVVSGNVVSNTLTAGVEVKNEVWNCSLNATDAIGNAGNPKSVNITIQNSPPEVTAVNYTPSTNVHKSTMALNCTVTASDIDNDALTFNYLHYKNNASTGITTQNITNSSYSTNDVLVCQGYANDGTANSNRLNSSSVTVSSIVISSCGITIDSWGDYILADDINMSSAEQTCIYMNTEAVSLDCQGHRITNYYSGTPQNWAIAFAYSNVNITNCIIDGRWGIAIFGQNLMYSTGLVKNNTINPYNNISAIGIYLQYCRNASIEDNRINAIESEVSEGISVGLYDCESSSITRNILNSENTGIILDGNSAYNLIFDNIINASNNFLYGIIGSNYFNTTRTSGTNIIGREGIGGNYWSNYTGRSIDGDFFGDTAYNLNNNSKDYLPLVFENNSKPYVIGITIFPSTAYTNSTLNCSALYYDDEGNKGNVSIRWLNGSVLYSTATILNVENRSMVSNSLIAGIQAKGETWNCTINATDSNNMAGNPNSTTKGISNTPPEVTNTAYSPTTAYKTTASLNCSVTAQDADGDSLTYSYLHFKNNVSISAIQNITNSSYNKSDVLICQGAVSDGSANSNKMNSSSVTIQNSAPTAPTLTQIAPATAYTTSLLSVNASNSSDIDSDNITYYYKWNDTNNAAVLQDWNTSPTFNCNTSGCNKNDIIIVYAMAYDGTGYSSFSSSQTKIINNSAPVLPSIGNKQANSSTQLNFTLGAGSDSDGDTLSYSNSTLPTGAFFNTTSSNRTFVWTPSANQNGTYNITFTVSDDSNATDSERILITVLASTQIYADNETETVGQNVTEIIYNSGSTNVTSIVIPSTITSTQSITLDLGALINSSQDVEVNARNITLTRETSSGSYSAVITNGTVISGNSTWDGKLILPTLKSSLDYSVSGGTVDVVVDFGTSGETNFSKAVKIVIGGKAGKKAAWGRNATLTEITTQCNRAESPTNISENSSPRECYIDSGSDLIVWTYHFTEFAAFTPTTTTVYIGSGGGGKGRVAITCTTEWQCSEWSSCINSVQTRTCSKINATCSASEKPEETRACEEKKNETVKKRAVLFDINLKISKNQITASEKLGVSIGLINLGDPGRVDANLRYTITDTSGNTVYSETQVVPVETQKEFVKYFDVSKLNRGSYKLKVDLTYAGQKEPAQAVGEFTITSKEELSRYNFLVISTILIFSAIVIVFIILLFKKIFFSGSYTNQ